MQAKHDPGSAPGRYPTRACLSVLVLVLVVLIPPGVLAGTQASVHRELWELSWQFAPVPVALCREGGWTGDDDAGIRGQARRKLAAAHEEFERVVSQRIPVAPDELLQDLAGGSNLFSSGGFGQSRHRLVPREEEGATSRRVECRLAFLAWYAFWNRQPLRAPEHLLRRYRLGVDLAGHTGRADEMARALKVQGESLQDLASMVLALGLSRKELGRVQKSYSRLRFRGTDRKNLRSWVRGLHGSRRRRIRQGERAGKLEVTEARLLLRALDIHREMAVRLLERSDDPASEEDYRDLHADLGATLPSSPRLRRLIPDLGGLNRALRILEARRTLLETAFDLASHYHLGELRWPRDLSRARPSSAGTFWAWDPFSHRELRYERRGAAPLLASVGPDGSFEDFDPDLDLVAAPPGLLLPEGSPDATGRSRRDTAVDCYTTRRELRGAVEMYLLDEGLEGVTLSPELQDEFVSGGYLERTGLACPCGGEYSWIPETWGISCTRHQTPVR